MDVRAEALGAWLCDGLVAVAFSSCGYASVALWFLLAALYSADPGAVDTKYE